MPMSKITDHIIENNITWEDTNEWRHTIDAPKYNSAGFLENNETKKKVVAYMKSLYLDNVNHYGYTEEGCSKANRVMETYFGGSWEKTKEEVWQWLDDVKLKEEL